MGIVGKLFGLGWWTFIDPLPFTGTSNFLLSSPLCSLALTNGDDIIICKLQFTFMLNREVERIFYYTHQSISICIWQFLKLFYQKH